MPSRFVKDMLMSRYSNDGRNPYGSRGGYVSNRRPRRDRNMGDYDDMDYARRDYGYDSARYDMYGSDYANRQSDYDMGGRGYERPVQPWDYRGYDMRRNDYGEDYARGGRRDYDDYDMRGGRDYNDYGEMQYGKMTKEDMEKWKKQLQNSDGSKGEHFRKEQVEQMARQMGINAQEMGGIDVFAMAVNMMYADYCAVAKKYGVDRPEYYGELAKAFLNDKDFKGKGEEKLWLYYKCIVEKED